MIPILFEKDAYIFNTNGIGRLRDCISCTVTEERNGIYECDFEYPVDGARFEDIQIGRIIVVEHDDSGNIQPFDIVSYSKPINGVVTFHAVHISYRLSKVVVSIDPPVNNLTDAINGLGTYVPYDYTNFSFDQEFNASGTMAAADGVPRSVRQMIGGVEGSILDTYGGELEFDGFRVYFYRARGVDRNLTIRYGVNLMEYDEEMDNSETYSACVPFWKGTDGTLVKGSLVDSGQYTITERVEAVALDLSQSFQTKPTAAQLETLARSMMTSGKTAQPKQSINVSFVQDPDPQLAALQVCRLCDRVRVEFPRYGMSGMFKIVKVVWNVLGERYEEMDLGALSTTLSEALGISNDLSSGTGLMDADGVVYQDYALTFSYSSGTVGTRGAEVTADGAKSGYKPVSATIIAGNTYYSSYVARVADNGTITLSAYRATTGARTNDSVTVRVTYLKQ